jgi:CRISPR-associated helicase Cas3/CRISPR-associated endonuclease Cas3-HD
MKFIAHVRKDGGGEWELHLLEKHLREVAKLAEKFSNKFGTDSIGYLIGLWHDLGKYKPEFQERIRILSDYDEEAHLEGKTAKHVDHSTLGGMKILEFLPMKIPLLSFPILGHHCGLQNLTDVQARLQKELEKENLIKIKPSIPNDIDKPQMKLISPKIKDKTLWIRMLFSALIDADRLDTEAFMNPEKASLRLPPDTDRLSILETMNTNLDNHLKSVMAKAKTTSSLINERREEILTTVNSKASLASGFFTLTVPTGGGKTFTSLSFALKHAIAHKKNRIIYAIPYTSIIEQNADVFRKAIGNEFVLEHHSNVDPELNKENQLNKLLTENWDHPLVVTTNVQFFESLFASKTSRCRKLHNITNSVVILDEAQMLPPEFLQPTINILKELVEFYGVTVILCTATQPALNSVNEMNYKFDGIDNPLELAPDTKMLFEYFDRTIIQQLDEITNYENLARKIEKHEQSLTIVNRKNDALQLFNLVSGNKYHLSTNMCAEHRKDILNKIKSALNENIPVTLISTQLIEAGVDIDFPVVYRALSGLDSIAQAAAGRCNREGKRVNERGKPIKGDVFIFTPEKPSPRGHLLQAEQAGEKVLSEFKHPIQPVAFKKYFEELFWVKGSKGLDKHEIEDLKATYQFEEIGNRFRLIEDDSFPVIVPYGNGIGIIQKLKKNPLDYLILRQAQRFLVNIKLPAYSRLKEEGYIEELDGKIGILVKSDLYNEETGLNAGNSFSYTAEELIV